MSDETLALQTSEEPTTASTEQSAPAPQPLRIEDIKPRMAFTGRVIRVELGGAFIDIGGLIGFLHISQIVPPDDKPVLRVADVLKENDTLTVYVSRVFPKRKRIDLTMRRPAAYGWDNLQVGMKLHNVKVVSVESFGVFVDFDGPKHALIPFNLMPKGMRPKVDDVIETAWVVEVDEPKRRIGLTMVEPPALPWERIKKGEKYPGKVVRVERNAAYVDIGAEREGVVRASSLGASFLDMRTFVTQGEEVTVKVLRADPGKRILELALEGVNPSDFALSSGPEEELSPFAVALQRAQRLKRAQEAASNAARAEESTS
ncbi:MAG: S1 RNA-binding domain-containing protein [Anaerolineae bacterium]|nr:S1 RNA-binding domain-containing protein [Thermoflexales bacterium]MDW8395004.1 S1 RNA-binding domain-containing protein [Anaerolineae bacterium]